MARPKKTKHNPYGLTPKQQATIAQVVKDVEDGKSLQLSKAHAKYYNTKNPAVLASENMNRPNYRQALLAHLTKRKIIGNNSKVQKRLEEGLDAVSAISTQKGIIHATDYKTRLAYVQELNKITGVYAPEKSERKSLNLNVDMTEEQLDNKIKALQGELDSST